MIFISTDILNPYERDILSTKDYDKLIDFLVDVFPKGFGKPTDISVNGNFVEVDNYDISLSDKDVIVLLDRTALPVGLIGGWLVTALANLAISVTLSYVANKLFAPDSPTDQAQPSSVYSLNNAQNMARYGSPIPIIYGKVRAFPSMVAQPYYKFENNIEYLYHVLCVGQGTLTTDFIMIDNDCVDNTGDVDWKLLYNDSFYNIPLNGYGAHITKTLSSPSNMELKISNGESEKYTISEDAEYVEFDYMYPKGLIHHEGDGETTSAKTAFTVTLYSRAGAVYTELYSESIYINAQVIDPIQTTWKKDISSYNEEIYISFQKTLGEATSSLITNTFVKRIKAIYPNEDFTNLYGDITLLTCRIKATNAVSSAGQVKVNGYFERTDVGNTMHEVLTDIYTNTTYGGALNTDDLDFPVTTETVNCAYDTHMTIFDAMRKPALAQGYSLYLAGMDVILKKDGVNTVTSAMYNEMNILRNSLKVQYLFKEEYPTYDGFECVYMDGCDWKPKSVKYPSTSIRPQRVELFGVVDYTLCASGCAAAEGVAEQTGWYTVKLNSDAYADYDLTTLSYSGGSFMGANPTNHTFDSNMELQTTGFYLNNVFKTKVSSISRLLADRDYNARDDITYRCILDFDKDTRTWNRVDASDYHLYAINQTASYSRSLGVCTNDPRFLVNISDDDDPELFNQSGNNPAYPKTGLIWLFEGESIESI